MMKSRELIIICFAILSFCLTCKSESSKRTDQAETAAVEAARKLIADQPMNDMQLQSRILEIRSNEFKLREAGFDKAADNYISIFEATVRAESDSLARIIF